jgi:hypothetical protein
MFNLAILHKAAGSQIEHPQEILINFATALDTGLTCIFQVKVIFIGACMCVCPWIFITNST